MNTGTQLPGRIGPYELVAPIGAGAFSSVAKCRHVDTGAVAAVKLAGSGLDHGARLQHEARVLSRLGQSPHPGVVQLLETGMHDGVPWTALNLVDGPDLRSLYPARRHGQLDTGWATVARVGRRIAEALAHVHGNGVIHCDLSPTNILLHEGSEPVLIDFNLALVAFEVSALREVVQPPVTFHGTPGYAAPEQLLGLGVDARSDLYALGCILYELVAGAPPFRADDVEALCQQHLYRSPLPLSSKLPAIPRELDDLILTLLQKNPKARIDGAEEVMRRLDQLSASVALGTAPTPRRCSLHRAHLIGRESDLQTLVSRLDETARGRGGFVLVSGKSGIGKTRLLNELAHRARGLTVVFGRCTAVASNHERLSAGQALQPFLPFLQWLSTYLPGRDAAISTELAIALAVLSRYEPSLERHAPSSVPALPPELGRSRVLQSLIEVLLAATEERPLLLMIDDLQWADDLTRAFFREDSRAFLESSRVLIVAAHRSEDAEPAELGNGVPRVDLTPLTGDELGLMATEMLGTELVPAGLAEALHRHSEGNPFFAAEYLRAFVECGYLRRKGAKDWELSDLGSQHAGVQFPTSLRDLFARRILGLTDAAKATLELSSLLGRQFGAALVAELVRDTESAAIHHALDELVEHGILEYLANNQYRFVHDKLREAQALAIPNARRRELHRSIALLLMTHSQSADSQVSQAELGLHWAEAGDPTKAVPHLQAAAEQAASRYMNADAIDLYALALSQIEIATARSPEDREAWVNQAISVGEARGDVLAWSARHQEACAQQDATLRLVPTSDPLRRTRLERKKAKAYWTLHDYENALAALQRAGSFLGHIDQLHEATEFHEWIEIQQGFLWLQYFARGTLSSSEELVQQLTKVVNEHGTQSQRSMFYEYAACDTLARENYRYSDRALAFARRSISELEASHEQLAQVADARFGAAFVLVQGSAVQCREAADLLEANLDLLRQLGEATLITRSLVYLAIARRRFGDVTAASQVAARARRSAERVRLLPYVGAAVACEAWVQWKNDDTTASYRTADEACLWWSKAPHAFPFQWLAKFVLLDSHYVTDNFAAAAGTISDLLSMDQQRFNPELDASLIACRGALARMSDPRGASLALRNVLELAQRYSYL